jgi:hypothetical protein
MPKCNIRSSARLTRGQERTETEHRNLSGNIQSLESVDNQGRSQHHFSSADKAARQTTLYNLLPAEERAECYVDALLTNIFYNTWGLPGYQLSATSRALISLGEKAVAVLKPLLGDRRFAPHSGSKDATASNVYGNRVCDYAWVFISEIRHRPYAYSQSPAERDLAIDELRESL